MIIEEDVYFIGVVKGIIYHFGDNDIITIKRNNIMIWEFPAIYLNNSGSFIDGDNYHILKKDDILTIELNNNEKQNKIYPILINKCDK